MNSPCCVPFQVDATGEEESALRIVAGSARGHGLFTPKGRDIRPTSDRVRGALFNLLGSVQDLVGLDLFAGTGALGLEALSRGAKHVLFVDKNRAAIDLVRRNLAHTKLETQADVWMMDAFRALKQLGNQNRRFDLILLDPPYQEVDFERLFDERLWKPLILPTSCAILETSTRRRLDFSPTGWDIGDRRSYGETELVILNANGMKEKSGHE